MRSTWRPESVTSRTASSVSIISLVLKRGLVHLRHVFVHRVEKLTPGNQCIWATILMADGFSVKREAVFAQQLVDLSRGQVLLPHFPGPSVERRCEVAMQLERP